MKPEVVCERVEVELSARLDGETSREMEAWLDDHLASCETCRAHRADLERARAFVRLQVLDRIPDLTARIMDQVRVESRSIARRRMLTRRLRLASVAAVATFGLLVSTVLPFSEDSSGVASATEIASRVRAAARKLHAYRADFSIVERGWHPRVNVRRFAVRIAYRAPEQMRIETRDLTSYPDPEQWPTNDSTLIADADRWWLHDEVSCPAAALPRCTMTVSDTRSVIRRQPFDGSTALPTDIIVPLETLAGGEGVTVLGMHTVDERTAYRIALPYHQAVPLIAGFQGAGSWRPFYPLDRVHVWIDRETWFPLRFQIEAADSRERSAWAERLGLHERSGRVLLSGKALSLSHAPVFSPSTFEAPRRATRTRDAGFSVRPDGMRFDRLRPRFKAGLSPYRQGVTRNGDLLVAYTSGTTWLKITSVQGVIGDPSAEVVRLTPGWGYYSPATAHLGRRVDLYGRRRTVRLESNLPRSDLLRTADSLELEGSKRRSKTHVAGATVVELSPREALVRGDFLSPGRLPAGYEPRAATLSRSARGRTLRLVYSREEVEYDGVGIRIIQSDAVDLLPPSSQEFDVVSIRGRTARWLPERGELEWMEDDRYFSISAPSLDLVTVARLADGLH